MDEPRRLGGRYELGQVLGRGGMAEVYLGHDIRLGRTVAVKTLRTDLARDPSFQARFRREAQSAASLNHPAIVAVYDTGEDYVDGISIPYIVMEYVDGSTLRELLHSGRRLLPERALEMTAGVLQALEYSHRSGIVHRDIKPANVMLTRNGTVKVMDFGIARAMADSGMTMTQTAAVIGTAQYLSPEQAKGETVDARSDLYSTGCLLYELLTLRPPFVGDSPVAVAYQHVREEPLPPSSYDPEVTPTMDAIVLRALAKDPDLRYQSADEMRMDIERALEGMPIAATAMMGAGGYDQYGNQQPTTMLPPQGAAGASAAAGTSLLPPTDGDDDGYEGRAARRNQQQGRGKAGWIALAIAAVLVIVGAILIGKALLGNKSDTSLTAPNLVGKTLAQAKTSAANVNLQVKQAGHKRCDQPKGAICSQDPASGASVKAQQTISVVVSDGAPLKAVPDVTNEQLPQAQTKLQHDGYQVKVKNKTITDGSAKPNTVLSQNPTAGTKVKSGATITLTVAQAPQNKNLPDVTTQRVSDAINNLKAAGFTNYHLTAASGQDPNAVNNPDAHVLAENPAGGSSVSLPPDTLITLTVAVPDTSSSAPATPTTPPADQGQTNQGQTNQGQTNGGTTGQPTTGTNQGQTNGQSNQGQTNGGQNTPIGGVFGGGQ